MRRFLFAIYLVVACATGAIAVPLEDGFSAYARGDYAQAMKFWRPLAAQGDAQAQVSLGALYATGQGVPQDSQEALKWFRLAAAQGNAMAQYNLSNMYRKGNGVPQDFVRAHMWSNLAGAALSGEEGKNAMKIRDRAALQMTAAQILLAKEMARRCQQTKFKECD